MIFIGFYTFSFHAWCMVYIFVHRASDDFRIFYVFCVCYEWILMVSCMFLQWLSWFCCVLLKLAYRTACVLARQFQLLVSGCNRIPTPCGCSLRSITPCRTSGRPRREKTTGRWLAGWRSIRPSRTTRTPRKGKSIGETNSMVLTCWEQSPVALTLTAMHDGIVPCMTSAVVKSDRAWRCYACAAQKCLSWP